MSEFNPPQPDAVQLPIIPQGVPGELMDFGGGRFVVRHEVDDQWVTYRGFDEDGNIKSRSVAVPRFQIISDEVTGQDNE